MAVNWNLGAPVDVGGAFTSGFERGQQRAFEAGRRNALTTFAQNPDDPNAINALAPYDPELTLRIRADQTKRQQAEALRQATQTALTGTGPEQQAAQAQIAGLDSDLWLKLDARTKDTVKRATSFIAQAGFEIDRLPEEQKAAAWGDYVRQAEASGLDIPAHYETYSPQALRAAVAEAGMTEQWIKASEPDYQAVPFDSTLVNLRDPASVAQFGAGGQGVQPVRVQTIEEARRLPPGTQFYDPNGVLRTVPGGAGSGPRNFP